MYIWMTDIIRCACTVRINFQKWARPSINSTYPSHLESQFGDPLLLDSGAIAFQRWHLNVSVIEQLYAFSDSVPCLFCKATF